MKKKLLNLSLAICLTAGMTLSSGNIAKADITYKIQGPNDPNHEYNIAVSSDKPVPGTVITVYRPTKTLATNPDETEFGIYYYETDDTGEIVESFNVFEGNGTLSRSDEYVQITVKTEANTIECAWYYESPDLKDMCSPFFWNSYGQMHTRDSKTQELVPISPIGTTDSTPASVVATPTADNAPAPTISNPFTPGEDGTIYRLLFPPTNKHLYSTDVNECQSLCAAGWVQETSPGVSATSGVGVYRVYNPTSDEHLFTADKNECDVLTTQGGWLLDNNSEPIFYGVENGNPVYRLYNPNVALVASHHYTSDKNEIKVLLGAGWQYDNGGNPVYYLQ